MALVIGPRAADTPRYPMDNADWTLRLREVHARGILAGKTGRRSPKTMFSLEDTEFLRSIGCSAQELFDFVDDYLCDAEPDLDEVIAIQSIRRDYFLNKMSGAWTGHVAAMAELPAKSAAVDGISWLPRLIVKARLKLRGEMPDDLMYGCGGDRPFVKRMRTTLAGFLQLVRDCGEDDRKIVDTLKRTAGIC
jgi:hypothetical protein